MFSFIHVFFNFFQQYYVVFIVQVFHLLDQFLSILFFDNILNEIIFIIPFLDWSLLVYRNATDFCVLTLYPAICWVYQFFISLLYYLHLKKFFWLHHATCGILVLWPGIEPVPRAVKVWSLNHWLRRKSLLISSNSFFLFSPQFPSLLKSFFRWENIAELSDWSPKSMFSANSQSLLNSWDVQLSPLSSALART